MDEPSTAQEAALFQEVWHRVRPEGSAQLMCSEGTPFSPPISEPLSLPLSHATPEDMKFLKERIEAELKTAHTLRQLHCGLEGEVRALSRQVRTRAKRLSAALMLLSGVWYLPEGQCSPRRYPDFRSAARGLFHSCQQDALLYAAAAQRTPDTLLSALYAELGEENLALRDHIRSLLER